MSKCSTSKGALAAIENGYQMREIEESAYRQQRAVESGEQIVVGVNAYRSETEDAGPPLLRVDEAMARGQIERIRAFRSRRGWLSVWCRRSSLLPPACCSVCTFRVTSWPASSRAGQSRCC